MPARSASVRIGSTRASASRGDSSRRAAKVVTGLAKTASVRSHHLRSDDGCSTRSTTASA